MNNHTKGLLLVLLGVVLMSFESPLIQKSGLDGSSVSFFFGICLFITTNLIMISYGKRKFIEAYTIQKKGLLLSGLLMGSSNFFFITAVTYTGIAKTVLILAISPISSALFSYFIFKTKTPKRIFLATIFVFLGLYIILKDDLGANSLIGNVLALCCVICFSLMFCTLSHYKESSRVAYVSIAAVVVTVLSFFGASFDVTLEELLPIIFMGIIITPFSRIFLGSGAKYLLPAEVGLLVIAESILAPIWGWLWLDEKISFATFLGGAIILGTLIINSYFSLKQTNN